MPLSPEDIEALDLPALDPADPADGAILQEAAVYYADKTEEIGVTAFRNRLAEVAVVNALRVHDAQAGGLTPHRAARGPLRSVGVSNLPNRMQRRR